MHYNNRLDSNGTYHHVISRAVDGCHPFLEDQDLEYFLDCLDRGFRLSGLSALAWAVMSNHVHLLMHCNGFPLSRFMQIVLLRFAQHYNTTRSRKGHVFMGRFRSMLVQEGTYLIELVRYIHLNPVRAGICRDVDELNCLGRTGHAAVGSGNAERWHDVRSMLALFGENPEIGASTYVDFLKSGLRLRRRSSFESGIWLCGREGVTELPAELANSRRYGFSGAIIGSKEFAVSVAGRTVPAGRDRIDPISARSRAEEHGMIERIITLICANEGLTPTRLRGKRRTPGVTKARTVIASILEDSLALSRSDIARLLFLTPAAVTRIMRRTEHSGLKEIYKTRYQDLIKQVKTEATSE